ncbi:MAG: peptidylprolyl isomerase [Chlorobiales bacterium]|nr:peptidylprolyl isomerase [Chlorobiales bacterium]
MAVMTKMRDSMHIVLYTLVGAFVLLIIFEWGMDFTGLKGRKNEAGRVNGTPITLAAYDATYKRYLDSYRQQMPNMDIDDQTDYRLRDQAWDFLVTEILLKEQYESLGLTVTDKELVDAVLSDNPPQIIAQQFRDPKTGTINREALQSAIADPKNKQAWIQVESFVRQELLFNKLQTLLTSTVLVTEPEARQRFDKQNTKVSGRFALFELARTKADSLYEVTDSEIKSYYNEHRDDYKQDPVRVGKFVMFSNVPTKEDSLELVKELKELAPKFQATKNDSEFVELQSDQSAGFIKTERRGSVSEQADQVIFGKADLKVGDVIGPYSDYSDLKLFKVRQIETGEPVAKASHILIKPKSDSKADSLTAIADAKTLLNRINAGEDFAKLAREVSEDPGSAQNGGSLGWFSKGKMIKEFEEAVFKAKPGDIVGPIQTQFGTHIIKVIGFDNREIVGAEFVRKIKASPATTERQHRLADEFQYLATEEGFDKIVSQQKLQAKETGEFTKNGFIPVIGFSYPVTSFAFNAEVGAISPVLETKDGFVIMKLIDQNDDGYHRLDDALKQGIKGKIIREKKMADLKKMAEDVLAKCGGSLDKAAQLDSMLTIRETGQVVISTGFVPGLGRDQNFLAALSAVKEGTLSKPIETNRGIAIAELTKKTIGTDEDFQGQKAMLRRQLLQEKKSTVMRSWIESLKKEAKIDDERGKML